MKNLWNIRMRASKIVVSRQSSVVGQKEVHISGAEGLYEASEIQRIVEGYIERALNHPRGKTDKIIITIEDVKKKPKEITALPLATLSCRIPAEGENIAIKLLKSLGISKRSIDRAFELIKRNGMRGAAIITAEKGDRLEPDKEKGVRVSRLGINKVVLKELSLRLSKLGIDTNTVKEALILASKVASCKHVIAELCISDDPYYTTGYVASKKFGYLRIPNIKHRGSKSGGRAFFVKEGINVKNIMNYLERMPVIIGRVASCRGIISTDEILNRPYK